MPFDEGLVLADKCVAEIRQRVVVAPPSYIFKVVDKDGVRLVAERFSQEIDNSS